MAKSEGQEKFDKLSYKKRNYFAEASEAERKQIFNYAEDYKTFLNEGKTERETCKIAIETAKKHGFSEYKFGDKLAVGDKKYFVNRGLTITANRKHTFDI